MVMQSRNQIRNHIHQLLGALGMKEPRKSEVADGLATPAFVVVCLVAFFGCIFYLFPGLRAWVPLATEASIEKPSPISTEPVPCAITFTDSTISDSGTAISVPYGLPPGTICTNNTRLYNNRVNVEVREKPVPVITNSDIHDNNTGIDGNDKSFILQNSEVNNNDTGGN